MKANNGSGNISERDLWETKQEFYELLNQQYNFGFDCCANNKNNKCLIYTSNFELYPGDRLYIHWMNPPFSIAKRMFIHFFKVIKKGVAIYRCDNLETEIYQEIILKNADWIFIPKGRVSYTPFEVGNMRNGNGTRFPSALIGLGVEPPKNIKGVLFQLKDEVK